jgi:hypothetical protein
MKPLSFKLLLTVLIIPIVIISSCQKDPDNNGDNNITGPKKFSELKIPDGFNFETSTDADIAVRVKTNRDVPLCKCQN